MINLFRFMMLLCVYLLIDLGTVTADSKQIRMSVWRTFQPLDPIYTTTTENFEIMGCLFDTLVTMSREGEIVTQHAKKWDISEDGKTYVLNLRDDIYWNDGTKVTAHDYVLGFQRQLNPQLTRAEKPTYMLEILKNSQKVISGEVPLSALGVRALDEQTLEFELEAPAPYFLSILAYPGMAAAPRHIIEEQGENWIEQRPLVSNGPFILVEKNQRELFLNKNENHWEGSDYDQLIIREYDNQDKILRDMVAGKLDIATEIRTTEIDWAVNRNNITKQDLSLAATIYASVNVNSEKLSDSRVRRALSLLIDRYSLATGLNNLPAFTFSSPSFFGESQIMGDSQFKQTREVRLKLARELLLQAGYSESNPLGIRITAIKKVNFDRLSVGIKAMWQTAGIDTEIVTVSYEEYVPMLREGDFDVALRIWYADFPDPFTYHAILRSNSPKNYGKWSNPDYDALLDSAYSITDWDERVQAHLKMEDIIANDSPVIPLVHPSVTLLYNDRINFSGGSSMGMIEPRRLKLSTAN